MVKNNANSDTPTDIRRSKPNINFELTYFSRCNLAITLLNILKYVVFLIYYKSALLHTRVMVNNIYDLQKENKLTNNQSIIWIYSSSTFTLTANKFGNSRTSRLTFEPLTDSNLPSYPFIGPPTTRIFLPFITSPISSTE